MQDWMVALGGEGGVGENGSHYIINLTAEDF
jgi:hypothetical protein